MSVLEGEVCGCFPTKVNIVGRPCQARNFLWVIEWSLDRGTSLPPFGEKKWEVQNQEWIQSSSSDLQKSLKFLPNLIFQPFIAVHEINYPCFNFFEKYDKKIAPNWSTDKQLTSTTNQKKSRNSEIPVQDNNFLQKKQHSPQRSTRWWSTKCQSFWKLSGTIRISNWQRRPNTATSLENCTQKCDIFLKPVKTRWLQPWVLS